MADNFFDQFDARSAPAAPAAAPGGQNFFNQFDGPNSAQAAMARQSPSFARQLAMAPVGAGEEFLKLGTGALASIPAGLAYGGAAIGRAFGADVNPAEVQRGVQNSLTYQPMSQSGQAADQAIGETAQIVAQPIVNAADRAATAVGQVSPTAETMMREAPAAFQAASTVVPLASGVQATRGAVALNNEAKTIAATRNPTPEEMAIGKAQGLGLKLLPSQQGRAPGAIAEGLAGQAKLERSLSKENAVRVDAAAAEEVGLPAGTRPTHEALAKKAQEASSVYKEVGELGTVETDPQFADAIAKISDRSGSGSFAEDTPAAVTRLKEIYGSKSEFEAQDAVAKVRQLRADASKNIKAPNAPEQNALGHAQRQIANILDEQMERAAQARGQNDLVARYKAARVQLAKIHSVQDAIRGSNVSAKALAKQNDRGVPLSGKLNDIAESYQSFDRVLQEPGKIRDSGPLGVVDYLVGAGAALHNPLLATAAASRPLVRSALASDFYQGIKRGPAGTVSQAPGPLSAPVMPAVVPGGLQTSLQVQAMIDAAQRKAAGQVQP